MECLSTKELPTGEQWTYEIKLDGFRVEAVRTDDQVILYSKQGKLLTSQFMPISLELEKLPPETVLDGELVALDRNGVPRFNLLQNYRSGSAHLMYFAFDILVHKGKDVTKLPLSERRELLRSTVKRGCASPIFHPGAMNLGFEDFEVVLEWILPSNRSAQ